MRKLSVIWPVVPFIAACAIYILITSYGTFCLTMPSDPLQYVEPALYPENGFPFFDRITTWLWIRAFTVLPVPDIYMGGIATLTVMMLTLVVGFVWLYKRLGIFPAYLFSFMFIISNIVVEQATYTYPSAIMTFVLVLTVALFDVAQSAEKRSFIGGAGYGIALLSKVQAYSFGVFLLINSFIESKYNFKKTIHSVRFIVAGVMLGLATLFLIIAILDGPSMIGMLIKQYFYSGVAKSQYHGRQANEFPPFYMLLEQPLNVFALIGCVIPIFVRKYRPLRIFALAGICQIIGLLFVYLVTMRGGAVIHNYWLDSQIIGLISFSGCFYLFMKDLWIKEGSLAIKMVSYPLPFVGLLLIYLNIFYPKTIPDVYSFIIIQVAFFPTLIAITTQSKISQRSKSSNALIVVKCLIIASFVSSMYFSIKPMRESITLALLKQHIAATSHEAAQKMSEVKTGTCWVSLRPNYLNRALKLYDVFYKKEGDNAKFNYKSPQPTSEKYILTDDEKILKSYNITGNSKEETFLIRR